MLVSGQKCLQLTINILGMIDHFTILHDLLSVIEMLIYRQRIVGLHERIISEIGLVGSELFLSILTVSHNLKYNRIQQGNLTVIFN